MGKFRHYNLTLDATAQQLSAALPGTDPVEIEDFGLRELQLQADDGNSNPVYIGGNNTVSAAAHGIRIPTPTGGVPDPPIRLGGFDSGPLKLSKIWVIGTDGEILNITGIGF